MKKKTVNKKRNHTKRFKKIFIFLILFFSAFLGFYLFVKKNNQNSFCANSISCLRDLSGNPEKFREGVFLNKAVTSPLIKEEYSDKKVLSGSSSKNKHIYINLSNQKLYAYEENNLIYEFPVSTGKWSFTPTGDFRIWIKLRATRMQGGNPETNTYYNLPNVPYTMYFYNENIPKSKGYGIHGAYWHNNFGHPMSHGCVNMRIEDSKILYEWADPPSEKYTTYASNINPGTLITIFGETPKE